jgi:hypothetical protein
MTQVVFETWLEDEGEIRKRLEIAFSDVGVDGIEILDKDC